MKISLVKISAGAERCFRVPVNFLEYSKAQLRLKAGNRFTVLLNQKRLATSLSKVTTAGHWERRLWTDLQELKLG
jgi:tRNA splicing ligase